ncbi:uncharacterized protein LOC114360649 [Ostrinia furnacalis]|uniref:uncharacterized protein LOC114360649 n=1 Tax=Ostrinia furnacalis TaxID=93504 RepID=UPI00103D4EE7|nr:uncharacterized protein LOC114360649 [Ostrinia furnacalis]
MTPAKRQTHCAVDGCKSRIRNSRQDLSFFALPKDEERRKAWAELIGRPDLAAPGIRPSRYVVCSLHFDDSAMIIMPRLLPNAMPTRQLPSECSVDKIKIVDIKSGGTHTSDGTTQMDSSVASSSNPRKRKLSDILSESQLNIEKVEIEIDEEVQSEESNGLK